MFQRIILVVGLIFPTTVFAQIVSLDARVDNGLRKEIAGVRARGWERIANRARLEALIRVHTLVPAPSRRSFRVDPQIGNADPEHRAIYQHARPEVWTFLELIGARSQHHGWTLVVTSAVRSEVYQARLMGREHTPAARPTQSSHTTGAAVDITRRGLGRACERWLETRLRALERAGYIQATRERFAYHIVVWRVDQGVARLLDSLESRHGTRRTRRR